MILKTDPCVTWQSLWGKGAKGACPIPPVPEQAVSSYIASPGASRQQTRFLLLVTTESLNITLVSCLGV